MAASAAVAAAFVVAVGFTAVAGSREAGFLEAGIPVPVFALRRRRGLGLHAPDRPVGLQPVDRPLLDRPPGVHRRDRVPGPLAAGGRMSCIARQLVLAGPGWTLVRVRRCVRAGESHVLT